MKIINLIEVLRTNYMNTIANVGVGETNINLFLINNKRSTIMLLLLFE